MKDEVPNSLPKNASLIINIDNEDGDGTHWVCVFHDIKKDGYIEYFDSFGLSPPEKVLNMMKKSNKKRLYSNSQIQSLTSSMCGYFCMYYILMRYNKIPIYDILYQFRQLNPESMTEDSFILIDYFNIK